MMNRNSVEIESDGKVGIIRLNDPATLNAMTVQMVEAFGLALDDLLPNSRAILVTGAGRAFCSGANLSVSPVEPTDGSRVDFGLALETHLNPLMSRLRNLPVPWISMVRGAAAGAGCALALAADMIVASETAYFMQAFTRVGLVPDAGSSHLLVRTIGRPRAMEMMMLGERVPARQALTWGLVNQVLPDDELEEAGRRLAARLAEGPRSLSMVRDLAWSAVDQDWDVSLEHERNMQRKAGYTRDVGEGINAFLEKRPAAFEGR
jgi:2-(1,2-epoxy-1,2-dihydrophenyl)acetyl-CoA isomerase